jgi:phosphomannomutase
VAFHCCSHRQLVIANDLNANIAAAASGAASAAAIYTATANNLQLVVANDPDADRLAAAEQTMAGGKGTGQFTTFSGNDIGLLLADWVWTNFWKQHPEVGMYNCNCLLQYPVKLQHLNKAPRVSAVASL